MNIRRRINVPFTAFMLLALGIVIACGSSSTSAAPTPSATIAATSAAVPTAVPTATTAPATVSAPTGTLTVAIDDFGGELFVLHAQPFRPGKFDNIVTHEPMFVTEPDGSIGPRLVKEWSVDSTGLIYTFHLQDGVKWQQRYGDWGEFNADDFIWSLEDVVLEGSPHAASGNIRRAYLCDGCELTKIDDLTVQLIRPTPTFEISWHTRTPNPSAMAFHSKRHYDAVGEDAALTQSVGTGPWELDELITGDRKVVRAVQDHWRKTPNFEELVWVSILEESTRLANFLAGTIDTGRFDLDSIQAIRSANNPDFEYMVFPGAFLTAIMLRGQNYFNDAPSHNPTPDGKPARVPLGDNAFDCSIPWISCDRDTSSAEWETARNVRLALALGVDRQKLVNNLALGEGAPSFVRDFLGFETRLKQFGLDELTYDYDPARAKELLAEAGYPQGFEVDAVLTAGVGKLVTQAVLTMWLDIGVTSKSREMDPTTNRAEHSRRTAQGVWSQAFPPTSIEPLDRYNILHNVNSGINIGFEHPVWQAMLDEANTLVDDEARWAKQAEMARWAFDNVMTIEIYGQNIVWPLGSRIGKWEPLGGGKDWLSNWEYVALR